MRNLGDLLGRQRLFFDGGTGTVLQGMGLKAGELPETWNLRHPERIVRLHYDYFKAGADIVKTNTFGAFITKFPLELERIVMAAVQNANEAREKIRAENPDGNHFVAFDIGPCGKLLKPMGDLDFEDCVSLFKKTFRIAVRQKIDCILIETMNDGYETKSAVIAAKEAMEDARISLPILVTNVYDKDCRTLSGSTPETMVAMLEGLGVAALGVNCSLGPLEMRGTVQRLCDAATVPVIVNPNAGLPKVVEGKTVFDVPPAQFVEAVEKIAPIGAGIFGGCCGTTPEYIEGIVKSLGKTEFPKNQGDKNPRDGWQSVGCASSGTRIVYFGKNHPTVLIGERINPTGKKKFKDALRSGDVPYIIHQGVEQEEAGAQILDVNVGLPEIDEKEMMIRVLDELQSVTSLPLQIDTTKPDVMEAALRRYNGKPMINSVNGKQEVMNQIFPLVKKYGGLVVALTLDEDGIPADSARRVQIAQRIYAEAEKYGIKKSDIIIDPLAMAVSSDSKSALSTIQTIREITGMGGLTSLGISNVSFGLPLREAVTASFFTLCMGAGLSAAIMNPLQGEMIKAWRCCNLLSGKDENCAQYIDWAAKEEEKRAELAAVTADAADRMPRPVAKLPAGTADAPDSELAAAIIRGLKKDAADITRELLQTTESLEIINNHLIPGLDFVGKCFEQKTMYLPQLLISAEAAKSAFGEIRAYLEKSGKKGKPKGKIILATVKGDIHDIGKNIVKVLLENYDFEVLDLGKDVPAEKIAEVCKKERISLTGLSALMTTTVSAMEETIRLLRTQCPWTKICVGGAVLTQEYADQIGADFYAKDAMDTVRYALDVFSNPPEA